MLWSSAAATMRSLLIQTFYLFFFFSAARLIAALAENDGRREHFETWSAADIGIEPVHNDNHIFNAIHSSMKQWGSSVHHNGMSLFFATVPAGTQIYHGTYHPEAVTGMEWLAFEPEHAMGFAHLIVRPPPPFVDEKDVSGPKLEPEQQEMHNLKLEGKHRDPRQTSSTTPLTPQWHDLSSSLERPLLEDPSLSQTRPPSPPRPPPDRLEPGWLHTYVPKHDLSLIYIDGMSAGKTDAGTLDLQDYLLLDERDRLPFDERRRAQDLCQLAEQRWKRQIDGFIRMEAGFEIILCNFEQHLDLKRSTRANSPAFVPGRAIHIWTWLRAITARYFGIGGQRVKIHYDKFTTVYSYDLDLFGHASNDSGRVPRISHIASSELDRIRNDLDKAVESWSSTVSSHEAPSSGGGRQEQSIDYQSIVDEIVQRYMTPLQYFLTLDNSTKLTQETKLLLRPFIDFDHSSNLTTALSGCTYQFLPQPSSLLAESATDKVQGLPLAYSATRSVSYRICSTLFSLISLDDKAPTSYETSSSYNSVTLESSRRILTNLISYLDWSTWRDCPEKCALDEICLIPIWPISWQDNNDFSKGSCVNETGLIDGFMRKSFPLDEFLKSSPMRTWDLLQREEQAATREHEDMLAVETYSARS